MDETLRLTGDHGSFARRLPSVRNGNDIANHDADDIDDGEEISIDEAEDEFDRNRKDAISGHPAASGDPTTPEADKVSLSGCSGCLDGVRRCCRRFGAEVRDCSDDFTRFVTSTKTRQVVRRHCCSLAALRDRLPCLKWIPKYRLEHLKGDLAAGITTGISVFPQGLAYGQIVEIPAIYGLYSSYMGSFAYAILGTSKDVAVGPSAVVSIITAQYGTGQSPILKDPTYAILLALFSGIILLAMGLLRLGFLISFISLPVLKAFRAAAGITIFMSRIKKWWGLQGVPREFLPQLYWSLNKLPETRLYDLLVGGLCILLLFLFKKLKAHKWKRKYKDLPIGLKIVKKVFWFLGAERNILVVIMGSGIVYATLDQGLLAWTGPLPPGIPPFRAPNFTLALPNSTIVLSFSDIASDIGVGFFFVPLVSLFETISIGKALGRKGNYIIDYNQEMIALGASNILCSFVSGHPITGAYLRSGINLNAGVKTPGGGILAGAIVLLALTFLTPILCYIPTCAMAATIMMGAIDVMTFHKFGYIWNLKRSDMIPWLLTFVSSLTLGIEYGVFFGVFISLVIHLIPALRPKMKVIPGGQASKVVILQTSSGCVFPAADYLTERLLKLIADGETKTIVLDLEHVFTVDTSIVYCLQRLEEKFKKAGANLFFCNLQKKVQTIFNRTNLANFCIDVNNVQDDGAGSLPFPCIRRINCTEFVR